MNNDFTCLNPHPSWLAHAKAHLSGARTAIEISTRLDGKRGAWASRALGYDEASTMIIILSSLAYHSLRWEPGRKRSNGMVFKSVIALEIFTNVTAR